MTRFKRRKLYVNRAFQARFIFKFCVVILIGGILSIALTFYSTSGTLTSTFENSRLTIKSTALAILPSVVLTNLITTGILVVIAILVTLFASHKIAGPIFRFQSGIGRIAEGDFGHRLNIRKGDQFEELVGSLNTMTTKLHASMEALRDAVDALAEKAEGREVSPDIIEDIKAIQHTIETRFNLD